MSVEDGLKKLANTAAAAALAPGVSELLFQLTASGLIQAPARAAALRSRAQRGGRINRVGIWERKPGDKASFARAPDAMAEWRYWANIGRIDPKSAKRRVVFLGESAARGYFYEPAFTPAAVLQSVLESVLGKGAVEVLDLARTDLGLEVRDVALDAAVLEPDAVVIFAGNNWSHHPLESDARACEAALESGGVAALRGLCESWTRTAAADVVSEVSAFYEGARIPLVWVVPESNLLDWRDPRVNATYLDGQASREWLDNADRAEEALRAGRYGKARSVAERMVELDCGTVGFGLRILAECALEAKDLKRARDALRSARDARIWDWSHSSSPRPYSVSQAAIREAARWGAGVVDLPEVFAEYSGGALPDRRLFTDYCHLTEEAIRVAMAATASAVLDKLRQQPPGLESLLSAAPSAPPKVRAEAGFLAAVHNAHWWQPADIVKYHCATALEASPHVADIMRTFAELQADAAPASLSAAGERLASLGDQSARYLVNSRQVLDPILQECIAECLSDRGVDIRVPVRRRLQKTHSVASAPCDLLNLYFLSAGGQPQEMVWVGGRPAGSELQSAPDYYKAFNIESRFAFVCEAGAVVELAITLRLPGTPGPNPNVRLTVNEVGVATICASDVWTTHMVALPSGVVVDGMNHLSLRWPLPLRMDAGRRASATRENECGRRAALFAVFGEVHALIARMAAAHCVSTGLAARTPERAGERRSR